MAFFKQNTDPDPTPSVIAKPNPNLALKETPRSDFPPRPEIAPMIDTNVPKVTTAPAQARKESLIASDLTIEGKIEGAGSVRIAGKFKGDVNVQGDLTIEAGAKLTGSIVANQVTIAGELEGNIEGAAKVDLQQTGVITGDVKAGSLTVASGARMRGQAVFGWEDERTVSKLGKSDKAENGFGS